MIVYVWWFLLTCYSFVALFVVYLNPYDVYSRIYITACAIRSIWPRQDGKRICLFDNWISYPFVGRSFATMAEVCFAYQLSMLIKQPIIFYLGIIAQFFCWYGVIHNTYKWHVYEETMWLMIGTICTTSPNRMVSYLSILYCLFMFFVDIPMYQKRHVLDEINGKKEEGHLRDTMQCKVDTSYEAWKSEIPWMTGYFVFATQFSMYMSRNHYRV